MNSPREIVLNGVAYIMLTRDEYEDIVDISEANASVARIRSGEEEAHPHEVVAKLIAGANPVRTFREWRGLKAIELAEKAGLKQSYLSEIENGHKPGSAVALKRIADVLKIDMDQLVTDID